MGVTSIQWCDFTLNPWIGCSKVHAGCAHCYAEEMMANRYRRVVWGPNGTRSKTGTWRDPVKWNREVEGAAERPRVFCASLADVFEDWQGPILSPGKDPVYLGKDGRASHRRNPRMTMDDMRRDLFALIDATPNLDWLLLTKRPENIRRMWHPCSRCNGNGRVELLEHCPVCDGRGGRRNAWLGTSISDQATADEWRKRLLEARDLTPVLFLSAEPLLGPVELDLTGIDWVIVGGESGSHARPCNLSWIRSIVQQCKASSTACFVKQLGANAVSNIKADHHGRIKRGSTMGSAAESPEPWRMWLEDKKGGDPDEWPEDLRIRQFPEPSHA